MNKKNKNRQIIILVVSTCLLIALVIFMMFEVSYLQGNGRIVNYTGIVRGATQRLVKNELYGNPDDLEIARLDDILLGLRTGQGSQNLTVLNDQNYLMKLRKLTDQWSVVKRAIYAYRADSSLADILYEKSEQYFDMADETVSAAEVYSDSLAKRLRVVEFLIILDIAFIILFLSIEILGEFKKNRNLRTIAYVDPLTGLPNKRSCDEKLKLGGILDEQNTCCMMFDLNNLKITNDQMGHETGDALISSFASLLRRTAPSDMFIGRFGGDEFIGIQMNSSKADIKTFVDELSQLSRNPLNTINGSSITLSYACGYAFSSEHEGCTLMSLMDIADKNMYQNKALMKSK